MVLRAGGYLLNFDLVAALHNERPYLWLRKAENIDKVAPDLRAL